MYAIPLEQTLSLINDYGRLLDDVPPGRVRLDQVTMVVLELIGAGFVSATPPGGIDMVDSSRLVGIQDGHRYVVDITWPDQPLPATSIQALA